MGGLLATFLLLVVAACGEGGDVAGGGDGGDELWGREFLSVEVERDGPPLVEGTRISLRFDEAGSIGAHAGCNTLGSDQVDLDGGRLRAGSMMSTEMGCDPPRHAQDEWLAEFLASEPSWTLDGDTLVLENGRSRMELRDRRTVEPDLPLEDVRWLVVGVIEGDSASTVPVGAHLTFSEGRVEGSTGCNDLSGAAEVDDEVVRVGEVEATQRGCDPDRAALEAAVLAVLDGEVGYRIEADSLTLTHPGGRGLMLTAETD